MNMRPEKLPFGITQNESIMWRSCLSIRKLSSLISESVQHILIKLIRVYSSLHLSRESDITSCRFRLYIKLKVSLINAIKNCLQNKRLVHEIKYRAYRNLQFLLETVFDKFVVNI